MLACLDLSLSTLGTWGSDGAEAVEAGGGEVSVFGVGTTRRVLGATDRLIGDPVAAVVAGLGGTDVVTGVGCGR